MLSTEFMTSKITFYKHFFRNPILVIRIVLLLTKNTILKSPERALLSIFEFLNSLNLLLNGLKIIS